MKKIIGYSVPIILFLSIFVFTPSVFAQTEIPTCNNGQGIVTAIGCIETSPTALVTKLFQLSLGIGGGIAFLMILIGGLQIQISTGDPKRLQQGREIIEGAVIGLLMIILSFVILRIIGINILAIPGFS